MKTTFKKGGATSSTATEPANSERALSTPQRGPLNAGVTHQGMNDMGGEWLATDRKLARINVVQQMSTELRKDYEFGDIVFGKNVKIADETNAATVVALYMLKDYQQVLKFGTGTGVVYKTQAEVFENGGTTDYSEEARDAKIYFGPRAHVQFAIKAPQDADENELNFFPFTSPVGDNWALGLITVASSAWTSLGKELETLRQNNRIMIQGLAFGLLELSSGFKKKGTQEWYSPIVKLVGQTDPGLREFLFSLSGVSAAASKE